ncbi:hypothetical protein [Vibrio rarus]|uniref:hypothetical protein n=1 Tax=Vibrio rarus TaxID=413403 RepID=UPI0021C4C0A2|nr:hypothetical protein [Vibrio rarus]
METKLLSVQDLGYKRHNRIHALRHRQIRGKSSYTIAREFSQNLQLMEHDILKFFGLLTRSKKERILRYRATNGTIKYQEIDFIAESDNGLKFCELKLKSQFKQKMNNKESGRYQLHSTTQAAQPKYMINGALSICVDMEYLYEGTNSNQNTHYSSISELKDHLEKRNVEELIWLNIKDILDIGLSNGWLSKYRICELRESHQIMHNPMLDMPPAHIIPQNTPFALLRQNMLSM